MISSAQAALFLTLISLSKGFSPNFGTPRQCSSLSISWASFSLPISPVALSEITLSLVPLDSNPAHFPPAPYTLAVPCSGEYAEAGQIEIAKLPFPAGTQFFASAYFPGASGPTRRTVSHVFTVEHSSDSSCLSVPAATLDKRAKAFGKRQVSVVGVNTVAATATDPSNDAAGASATTTGSVPPINVVGVGSIPASDTGSDPAATSNASAAPTATGAVPPINVIGVTQIPVSGGSSGTDAPVNVVPLPSSTGVAPPIQVIGTSFVTLTAAPDATATATTTNAAFVPNFTTLQVGADQVTTTSCTDTPTETPMMEPTETTTSCTDTPTETPMMESLQGQDVMTTTTTMMNEMPSNNGMADSSDMSSEEPCTDATGTDASKVATTTSIYITSPTADSAVQYGSFDDMVNAANSLFHAWNPYKPAYTPST